MARVEYGMVIIAVASLLLLCSRSLVHQRYRAFSPACYGFLNCSTYQTAYRSLVTHIERTLGIINIRGNELWVLDAALLQRRIHCLHDDDTLTQR